MSRLAVVLFNLGGPDSPAAVRPFLFNLFNDAAIIGAPVPVRWLLAQLISRRRAPQARRIYERLGGASPLLAHSREQAQALEARLDGATEEDVRVFVCMRYWHPMSGEVAADVAAFGADRVVLVPLYPQFSTTTTGSSLAEWRRAAAVQGIAAETFAVCCYPTDEGVVAAQAAMIADGIAAARRAGNPRVLFSAHGLPKKIVAAGDPYAWQVERTARVVAGRLGLAATDWTVCYQSRVGPLEWIGPSTPEELHRAAADKVPVVVVPIAFVSEHSETLVELDEDYARLAADAGIPAYVRVPALGTHDAFIEGLASLVRRAPADGAGRCGRQGGRLCPGEFAGCAHGRRLKGGAVP